MLHALSLRIPLTILWDRFLRSSLDRLANEDSESLSNLPKQCGQDLASQRQHLQPQDGFAFSRLPFLQWPGPVNFWVLGRDPGSVAVKCLPSKWDAAFRAGNQHIYSASWLWLGSVSTIFWLLSLLQNFTLMRGVFCFLIILFITTMLSVLKPHKVNIVLQKSRCPCLQASKTTG